MLLRLGIGCHAYADTRNAIAENHICWHQATQKRHLYLLGIGAWQFGHTPSLADLLKDCPRLTKFRRFIKVETESHAV